MLKHFLPYEAIILLKMLYHLDFIIILQRYCSRINARRRLTDYLNYFMNKNHYDTRQVCLAKANRVRRNIQRIEDAMGILEELPHDLVQHEWNKVVDRIQGQRFTGQEKTKPISKGAYRRSMRKTLQCLKVEQQKALSQVEHRLREAQNDEQERGNNLMQRLKSYVAEQRILVPLTE